MNIVVARADAGRTFNSSKPWDHLRKRLYQFTVFGCLLLASTCGSNKVRLCKRGFFSALASDHRESSMIAETESCTFRHEP